MKQELVYLAFDLSQENLKMDPNKMDIIVNWSTPKATTQVITFHDFAQYYKMFIKHFSTIYAPMLDTIKGGMKKKFHWTPQEDNGFQKIA